MASGTDDPETLEALNRGYLLAAEKSDVAWYTEHLAEDYRATNPDGSFVDKVGFETGAPVQRPLVCDAVTVHFLADTFEGCP